MCATTLNRNSNSKSSFNVQAFQQYVALNGGVKTGQPASSLYRSGSYNSVLSQHQNSGAETLSGGFAQKTLYNPDGVTAKKNVNTTLLSLPRGHCPSIPHDPCQEAAYINLVNSMSDADVNLFSEPTATLPTSGTEHHGKSQVPARPSLYGEYRKTRPPRASEKGDAPQVIVSGLRYHGDAVKPTAAVPPRHPEPMRVELSDLMKKATAKNLQGTSGNPLYLRSFQSDRSLSSDQGTSLYGNVRDQRSVRGAMDKEQLEVFKRRVVAGADVRPVPVIHGYYPMSSAEAPGSLGLVCGRAESTECFEDQVMEESPEAQSKEGLPSSAESANSDVMLCCEELDVPQDTADLVKGHHHDQLVFPNKHQAMPLAVLTAVPPFWTDHSSPRALAQANKIMSQVHIPGGIRYLWVSEDNVMYQLGTRWGFTAYAIALGSSYFQRLLESITQLEQAVRSNAKYRDYVAHMDAGRGRPMLAPSGAPDSGPQSVQFACIYIAAKVADQIPALEMLRYMLSKLYGTLIPRQHASEVEGRCLDELHWRLGPFFSEDDIAQIEGLDELY